MSARYSRKGVSVYINRNNVIQKEIAEMARIGGKGQALAEGFPYFFTGVFRGSYVLSFNS